MKTYKNWKLVKESVGTSFTLGVKSPNVVGTVGTSFGFEEIDKILDEAKKKCSKCKRMDGEIEEPKAEPEVDDDADLDAKKVDPEKLDKPEEPEETPEEEPEEPEEKPTLFQKKKQKKMKKEETNTDASWWDSVHKQLSGGLPGEKFFDGVEPGQPGFAPNTRIGFGANESVTAEEKLNAIITKLANDPRISEEVKKEYGLLS